MNNHTDDAAFMDEEEDWSASRPPARGKVRIVIEGAPDEPLVAETFMRLMLGGAVIGKDQLAQRLKRWQTNADLRGSQIYAEPPEESDEERLRYAVIGLLGQTPSAAGSLLSKLVNVTDSGYATLSELLSPVTNSRLARPFQDRYDRLAARGETIVERWVDAGRLTEQRSRALAEEAAVDGTDEAFDEVLGIMATKPEVRELITQQSIGMAGMFVGILRERGAAADRDWEKRIRKLFRLH